MQEKEIRVKFNPGLSANRPSNNWAQERSDDWKFVCIRRQHELGLSPQTLPYDLEKIFRASFGILCVGDIGFGER